MMGGREKGRGRKRLPALEAFYASVRTAHQLVEGYPPPSPLSQHTHTHTINNKKLAGADYEQRFIHTNGHREIKKRDF
jgi:hypothetical protein